MKKYFHVSFLIPVLLLAACTAHYPVNESIMAIDPLSGYRLGISQQSTVRSESLLVTLAFSGGGTRAAAFSYGVLEALREINITWEGKQRRLLDEIDNISSVSGGSFTAAYYGLFGDRIFEDFAERFLYQDVEGHLKRSLFKPWTWTLLGSAMYGRSELAADYYDEILFEGKTFGDMMQHGGPLIQINATEVSTSTQFTFIQDLFDMLCSDLSSYPVSRAVAASSAVPVVFTSVTLDNHAGTCGFQLSQLAKDALNDPDPTSRRRHLAEKYVKYLDRESYPYLHFYDGGLTDNLGIRPGLNRLAFTGDAWKMAKLRKATDVKRLVFIVVNAQAESKKHYSQQATPVPLMDTIMGATAIPLNEYTFESLVTLKTVMNTFGKQIIEGRCKERAATGADTTDCADFKIYMVVVDLDNLQDRAKSEYLKQLPTSFVLNPEDVDNLRQAAKEVLLQSPEFQKFLSELE